MKLLVLGCGSIGKPHVSNFSELADVAVYDQNRDAVKDLSVRAFETLDSALQWRPDAVIVSTPHDTHLEMATHALNSGAHVLVEKPISNALNGVSDLIELASEKTKKLHVVCNMRFHSAVAVLKENLESIGRPLFARAYYGNYLPNMRPNVDYRSLYAANRHQGGGVVLDAIHELDYLCWLFGPVAAVTAESDKLSDLDIDVEDYASIHLHHKNGVQAEVHLDYLQRCKRRGCEIVGEQGTLIWESVGKNPDQCSVRLFSLEKNTWEMLYQNNDEPANKSYQTLSRNFIRAVLEDNELLATANDGLQALRVALAALESAKIGKRMVLN